MREVTKGESRGKYNQRELDVIEEVLQNPHIVTKDITEMVLPRLTETRRTERERLMIMVWNAIPYINIKAERRSL